MNDNYKATFKKGGVLLGDLERHVLRTFVDDHDTTHLHPSEMAKKNWCPRHSYFRCIDTKVEREHRPKSFTMVNALTTGNDIHLKYQRWFAEMGILWGQWKCRHCNRTRYGKVQRFCLHEGCTGTEQYMEVPFTDERHHTWGHADGVVLVGTEFMLIEIKSIGFGTLRFEALGLHDSMMQKLKTPDEVWNSIHKPFPSHEVQVQIYLQLMRECYPTIQDVDMALVYYEWKATGQVKEFVIKRDDKFSDPFMDSASEVAIAIRTKGVTMPSYPSWADIDTPFCQACDYYRSCYSIETPDVEPEPQRPRRQITIQKTTSTRRRKALG